MERILGYKPTIIGIADATHYLVGGTDDSGNFIALPQLGEVAVCPSLSSAKQLLRDQKFTSAELTLESAYDEMCGLPAGPPVSETVDL
jgi:hypothetical protein